MKRKNNNTPTAPRQQRSDGKRELYSEISFYNGESIPYEQRVKRVLDAFVYVDHVLVDWMEALSTSEV